MANELADLIELSKQSNANMEMLIKDAYVRGLGRGIEHAKKKAIEAIEQEK